MVQWGSWLRKCPYRLGGMTLTSVKQNVILTISPFCSMLEMSEFTSSQALNREDDDRGRRCGGGGAYLAGSIWLSGKIGPVENVDKCE
jgi:hypothetical protein